MAEKKKLKDGKQTHVRMSEELHLRVKQYKDKQRMRSWCEAFRTLLAIGLAEQASGERMDLTPKELVSSGTIAE